MTQFAARTPTGEAVQQLEVLLRTALFKPASVLVEHLLQEAVDRIDAQTVRAIVQYVAGTPVNEVPSDPSGA